MKLVSNKNNKIIVVFIYTSSNINQSLLLYLRQTCDVLIM